MTRNGGDVRLHVANLHPGRVRPKKRRGPRPLRGAHGRREVERVLHVARGMFGGHVERFEVVPVVFEFGAVDDLIAHAGKDVFDALAHLRERMTAADRGHPARQRDIDRARDRRVRLTIAASRAASVASMSRFSALAAAPKHAPLVDGAGGDALTAAFARPSRAAQEQVATASRSASVAMDACGLVEALANAFELRIGSHRCSDRAARAACRGSPDEAYGQARAAAPLACSATVLNAPGWFTASSARLLRSSPTPATFSPRMSSP